MTETKPKPKAEILQEQITVLTERLAKIEAGRENTTVKQSPDSPKPDDSKPQIPASSNHIHEKPAKQESGLEHYDNCPTCHKEINEKAKKELEPIIEKEVLSKQREKFKGMKDPVVCVGCGEIVESTEPGCPGCKGTKARKFTY